MPTIVNDFTGLPAGLLLKQYAAASDIPVEFYMSWDKWIWGDRGQGRTWLYMNQNILADYSGDLPYTIPSGFHMGDPGGTEILHDGDNGDSGSIQTYGQNDWLSAYHGDTLIYCHPTAGTSYLSSNGEVVIQNATKIGGVYIDATASDPGSSHFGFRPMASAPSSGVFVDNLAFTGWGNFDLRTRWDDQMYTGPAGSVNNQFIGMLKREKAGSTAAALTAADVVFGMLSQGQYAKIIANGTVVYTQDFGYATGMRELVLDFQTNEDWTYKNAADYNSITVNINSVSIYDGTHGTGSDSFAFTQDVTVSMAGAVLAVINDASMRGLGGNYTGYADGYWEGKILLDDNYNNEAAFGAWYVPGETIPDPPQPPVNDNFIDAITLSGSVGTTNGTTTLATFESGEPYNAGDTTSSTTVWYEWTAPASGFVSFDTFGSMRDTTLGVYVGSAVDGLTTIASNDDSAGGTSGGESQVKFYAHAGTTYYISVGAYAPSYAGDFTLNWLIAPPVISQFLFFGR